VAWAAHAARHDVNTHDQITGAWKANRLELLRHRPLSPHRGRGSGEWRAAVAILGMLAGALSVVAILQQIGLGEARTAERARERIECMGNLAAMRRQVAAYLAIDKAVQRLAADPAHGLKPLIAATIAGSDATANQDFRSALQTLLAAVYDKAAGNATDDQVQQQIDTVLVEGKKAAERTQTLINAAVPQGC
jgi:hypothetical protein